MNNNVSRVRAADRVVLGLCVVLLLCTVGAVGQSGRGRAKRAVCVSNARQLTAAWQLFADDHEGTLVGGDTRETRDWVRYQGGYNPEQEKDGIRAGALFAYVGDVRIYRCPGDLRLYDPMQRAFRSYSIVDGMNGEEFGVIPVNTMSEIDSPSCQYVFVEEPDPRGGNMGSWCMDVRRKTWIDPVANWHDRRGTLGFADGHADAHAWLDDSTVEMADLAGAGGPAFYYPVPEDEGRDVQYMLAGYTYRALK